MQKGFDSQASLYRAMLASGGPKNADEAELAARLKAAAETGVVYYLLNDQVALSDIGAAGCRGALPGWRALGGDIASEALARIGQHLEEVRAGQRRAQSRERSRSSSRRKRASSRTHSRRVR